MIRAHTLLDKADHRLILALILFAVTLTTGLSVATALEAKTIHQRNIQIAELQSSYSSSTSNSDDQQNTTNDIQQQLDDSKSKYNDLRQAVISQAANQHSAELTNLYSTCGSLSSVQPMPQVGGHLPPAQQKFFNCTMAAQDSYIDDFIQNNQ